MVAAHRLPCNQLWSLFPMIHCVLVFHRRFLLVLKQKKKNYIFFYIFFIFFIDNIKMFQWKTVLNTLKTKKIQMLKRMLNKKHRKIFKWIFIVLTESIFKNYFTSEKQIKFRNKRNIIISWKNNFLFNERINRKERIKINFWIETTYTCTMLCEIS